MSRHLKSAFRGIMSCASVWCAVTVLTASASIIEELSLDQLVEYSDAVVEGKCTNVRSEWIEKKIYTIATVEVQSQAKGVAAAGQQVEVYMLGGRVREPVPVKMHVPGAATMDVGEEAVLFLEARQRPASSANKGAISAAPAAPAYRLVGMRQGKVKISTDPKTGVREAGIPGNKMGLSGLVEASQQPGSAKPAPGALRLGEAVKNRDGSVGSLLDLVRAVCECQAEAARAEEGKVAP